MIYVLAGFLFGLFVGGSVTLVAIDAFDKHVTIKRNGPITFVKVKLFGYTFNASYSKDKRK